MLYVLGGSQAFWDGNFLNTLKCSNCCDRQNIGLQNGVDCNVADFGKEDVLGFSPVPVKLCKVIYDLLTLPSGVMLASNLCSDKNTGIGMRFVL